MCSKTVEGSGNVTLFNSFRDFEISKDLQGLKTMPPRQGRAGLQRAIITLVYPGIYICALVYMCGRNHARLYWGEG
jgi:hypothetical protein